MKIQPKRNKDASGGQQAAGPFLHGPGISYAAHSISNPNADGNKL